jgi:hypothetical protein
MYKNIRKCLAIGTLSVVCLLQVGCVPGDFDIGPYNNNGYYNNGYMMPYYIGGGGYYWGTPNNKAESNLKCDNSI